VAAHKSGQKLVVDEETLQSFDAIAFELMDANPSLAREMLILPGEKAMVQKMEVYDFQAAKAARDALRLAIATRFKNRFAELYKKYSGIAAEHEAKKDAPVINKEAMVARRIKNACLSYLDSQGEEFIMMAETQFKTAKNMTDEAAALKILSDNKEKSDEYMAAFYEKWKHEELVLQRWRSLLGLMDLDNVFEKVEAFTKSDRFDFNKPGHVLNLLGGFIGNPARFHDANGKAYGLVVDVAIKSKNPYAASRILREAFGCLPRMDAARQKLMREQLQRLIATPGLDDSQMLAAKKILEG
jgi:aminopeptidase N